jgi:hypothetical protein
MKTFDTFDGVTGMMDCMKKPLVVHAKRIDEEFRVNTLEGNYKQGKPGDYLMRGIDGELYICDGPIFNRSYNWMNDEANSVQFKQT